MTTVGLPPRRMVHVGVRSSAGVVVGTDEHRIALAGEDATERALAVVDDSPRAIAMQPHEQFGLGCRRAPLFTVLAGVQGARGRTGESGGSTLPRTAGQLLSALRAVYELNGQVFYLDYRDAEHIDLLLGITLTAAALGSPINVQRSGAIDDSNWNWTPGRVWLGIDGALTQTPPADGFDVLIGAAVSATRIILDLTDPIDLE